MKTQSRLGFGLLLATGLIATPLHAAMNNATVAKKFKYVQTADNTPPATPVIQFEADMGFDQENEATAGELHFLANTIPFEKDGRWFYLERSYGSKAELDAAFPGSTVYTLLYSGGTLGANQVQLNLGSDMYPAQIPYFTGTTYSRAQTQFNPANDFRFHWNSFTPHAGSIHSLISFSIWRTRGDWSQDVFLDHPDTRFDVTAGTLQPSTTYTVSLSFVNTSQDTYNPHLAAAYMSSVEFDFTTLSLWDAGYVPIGGGWRRLAWFGSYVPLQNQDGWHWHNRFGYFFVSGNSRPNSLFLYTTGMGWLFTRDTLFPYLYRFSDQSWLWYIRDSRNPRWFRNLRTGLWEQR